MASAAPANARGRMPRAGLLGERWTREPGNGSQVRQHLAGEADTCEHFAGLDSAIHGLLVGVAADQPFEYRSRRNAKNARRPCASPPRGLPGRSLSFQAYTSTCSQGTVEGTKRSRYSAAVIAPA